MTRPAGKTLQPVSTEEGERLPPPLRLLHSPSPPSPAKASGWSGPLGAVDTAGGRTDSLELRSLAYSRKQALPGCAEK